MKLVFLKGDNCTTWGCQMEVWGQFQFNLAVGPTFSAKEQTQNLHDNLNKNNRELGNKIFHYASSVKSC